MKTNLNSIHFETLGCKVNQIESESIARSFSDEGFVCTMGGITSSSDVNESVIVSIINTCTVTAKAEQKARRLIRLLLEKHPMSCILVTGCYAELEKALLEHIDSRICVVKGTKKDVLAELPKEIHAYLLEHSLSENFPVDLSNHCSRYLDRTIQTFSISKKPRSFVLSTDVFMQHSRASIKIQDGCSYRCSYCRICLARGPSVSLESNEVLKRIQDLENSGHHEVTLTGINLSLYKSGDMNFALLLAYILAHTKKICLRISSLHPQSVTDELCSTLSHERVMPHFHLSIQSGSDNILKKMARPYTNEMIVSAIKKLRKVKENPFIACDIIVGFPGESEEDFMLTKSLCENEKLTWVHAFPFSPRPDTPAYNMEPKIAKHILTERVKVLTDIAITNKRNYINACVGKKVSGIVEKFRKTGIHVVTENFLHVVAKSKLSAEHNDNLAGKKVLVLIEGSDKKDLRQAEGEALGSIVSLIV